VSFTFTFNVIQYTCYVFLSVEIIIIIMRQTPAVQQVTLAGSHHITAFHTAIYGNVRLLLGRLPLVSQTHGVYNDTHRHTPAHTYVQLRILIPLSIFFPLQITITGEISASRRDMRSAPF
jgi:hypothetical protein